MQEYVRNVEIEQLLSLYNDLRGMAQSIKIQIDNIRGSGVTDDDILGMALPHRDFDNTPSYSPGVVTDKTSNTALKYETLLTAEAQEAMKELRGDLLLVETVIDKLNVALSILPVLQKDIIVYRYCDGLKWDEIDKIVNKTEYIMSVSAMKARGKEGIERLTKISRITIPEHQAAMSLFGY